LFVLDNARDLLKQELADTFIPTVAFERLLSPQNNIIIGSRGSGKTALLKMICHDHLSLFDNDLAKKIIKEKTYIGVFVSTKTKFSGGLKNKAWQTDGEKEKHFVWQMNIASCIAFLDTLRSCVNAYVDEEKRIEKEIEIISKIREYWFETRTDIFTIDDAKQALEDIAILRQRESLKIRISDVTTKNIVGYEFDIELFDPLLAAIGVINRKLDFPETSSWFICVDEIEMLEEFHHKILNSYMRSRQPYIYFKYTTLPYCHYTLDTNLNVPLDVRHDVHYIYIDQDISFAYRAETNNSNALKLFQKRATLSKPEYANLNFIDLFGKSLLLDSKKIDYAEFDKYKKDILTRNEVIDIMNKNEILRLFLEHMNENYKERGIALLQNKQIKRFGNEFGRKTRAILNLKNYFKELEGNEPQSIYSGAKTVVNVGDCNPRKLIKIFNEMLIKAEDRKIKVEDRIDGNPLFEDKLQNLVLATIADQEINRYKIERNFGGGLFDFINAIGNYMRAQIHENKLNTEQLSSIEINKNNEDIHWELVKRAVQRGLLYPNVNINNPNDMPVREGVFHLALILSPKFRLLPRKGDARNISRIWGETQLKINFDA
jgi:hypothetical protein